MALVVMLFLAKSAIPCGCWTDPLREGDGFAAVSTQMAATGDVPADKLLGGTKLTDGCKRFCGQQFTTPPSAVSIVRSTEPPVLLGSHIPVATTVGPTANPFRPPIA